MEATAGNIEIGEVRAHRTWEEGNVERLLEQSENTEDMSLKMLLFYAPWENVTKGMSDQSKIVVKKQYGTTI